MDLVLQSIILLVIGLFGGFMAGLLGIGGGVVFVVVLQHYLQTAGVPSEIIVPVTIANSMFCILCAGIAGSIKQYRYGNFYLFPIVFSGVPATMASIFIGRLLSTATWYDKKAFNWVFVVILGYIAVSVLYRNDEKQTKPPVEKRFFFGVIGWLSGALAAFTGVGGGILIVPFYNRLLRYPIKQATSISLGIIVLMALGTTIFNTINHQVYIGLPYSIGLISLMHSLPLAIGSVLSSPYGVSASQKLSAQRIRIIFFVFVTLVLLKSVYEIVVGN